MPVPCRFHADSMLIPYFLHIVEHVSFFQSSCAQTSTPTVKLNLSQERPIEIGNQLSYSGCTIDEIKILLLLDGHNFLKN